MNEEILKLIREKGILLDKEVFDLVNGMADSGMARALLESLEKFSGQKIITKNVLGNNIAIVKNIVNKFPGEDKSFVERTFVKLGISFEIMKEREIVIPKREENITGQKVHFKVINADTTDKKIEVGDFVGNMRARYSFLQKILMYRPELQNLVSINKISGDRTNLSIIGMVTEKRMTKNHNLILKIEDLTGQVNALVKADRKEIFDKAHELLLDDVVGIRASGSSEMIFVHEIIFPDSVLLEKKKFDENKSVVFLSDVHCGGDRHLGDSFQRFLEWINSDDEVARSVKYIIFNGDNVDGVGIFPGQESVLKLKTMEEQYALLASYLRRIPKHITIFMGPGQHDAVRVAEPQPIMDNKYTQALKEFDNLVLVTSPCMIKLLEGEKEFKIQMYHGASLNDFINEIYELRDIKAYTCPAKAVKHMLKRRHLSPTHSDSTYIPNVHKDPLIIEEVPDVITTADLHKADIENYNGVLIVTSSCWQAQTPFEEKVGHIPDPCKVPVLNLKTRAIKVYDFSGDEK